METTFFLDVQAADFREKMTAMYKSLDSQDPMLCALMGAAHIDKCLVSMLEWYFVQGKSTKEKILEKGFLSSLYARAAIAYMLGLIGKKMFTDINAICTIRNMFAHSHTPLDFESKDIAKLCENLTTQTPDVIVTVEGDDELAADIKAIEKQPKNRFVKSVGEIVLSLAFLPQTLERPRTPFSGGDDLR